MEGVVSQTAEMSHRETAPSDLCTLHENSGDDFRFTKKYGQTPKNYIGVRQKLYGRPSKSTYISVRISVLEKNTEKSAKKKKK